MFEKEKNFLVKNVFNKGNANLESTQMFAGKSKGSEGL